ncbi:Cpe/LpqF family protein [Streptosporangium lutulentum]
MRLPFRSTRFLALAVVTAAVPLAALAGGGQAATASTAQVVTAAPEIPDSPAGRQLRWFLDAPNRAPLTESELGEHLNGAYLQALTADGFNAFLKNVTGFQLEELTTVTPTALVGAGTIGGQKFIVQIRVDTAGKIDLIGVTLPTPPPPPPHELEAARHPAPRGGPRGRLPRRRDRLPGPVRGRPRRESGQGAAPGLDLQALRDGRRGREGP